MGLLVWFVGLASAGVGLWYLFGLPSGCVVPLACCLWLCFCVTFSNLVNCGCGLIWRWFGLVYGFVLCAWISGGFVWCDSVV